MDSYVRMFDDIFIAKDDNPTIGLILCSEKNEAIARYSMLNDFWIRIGSNLSFICGRCLHVSELRYFSLLKYYEDSYTFRDMKILSLMLPNISISDIFLGAAATFAPMDLSSYEENLFSNGNGI
jgi:hypothetical protein